MTGASRRRPSPPTWASRRLPYRSGRSGQSLPDVSLLPRIAAYFSLTIDELFDWRGELTEEESAALYAEVYALSEKGLVAAHDRLQELVAEHYSDANLLLMLASLLTVWAAGMATPFAPAGERDSALDSAMLADEALVLLDRAFEVATDPSTLYLAQQQKATTLFQTSRYEEAATLLEPLVRRQDAGAPTMLLASAYRKLGRDGEAIELLQAERLRAASFVLSSLTQEVGMRSDAAFAPCCRRRCRGNLRLARHGRGEPVVSGHDVPRGRRDLRRAGEKDGALEALARAVDALSATPVNPDPSSSPLWDRMADRLDPAQAGEAWAEHKARQAGGGRRAHAPRARRGGHVPRVARACGRRPALPRDRRGGNASFRREGGGRWRCLTFGALRLIAPASARAQRRSQAPPPCSSPTPPWRSRPPSSPSSSSTGGLAAGDVTPVAVLACALVAAAAAGSALSVLAARTLAAAGEGVAADLRGGPRAPHPQCVGGLDVPGATTATSRRASPKRRASRRSSPRPASPSRAACARRWARPSPLLR